MNNLCIDFGNTNVKLSIYQEGLEVYYYKDKSLSQDKVHDLFESYNIKKTIISSTRELEDEFIQHLKTHSHLIVLDHNTTIPIENNYETPETLGKDRLAAVIGAYKMFADETCVVIDAGTCITMDVIDNLGVYHGGNISPGIYMRRQAMHDFTDNLPLVDLSYPNSFIGANTSAAMQNGILRGTIYEIETFIDSVSDIFGPVKVVFTGGDIKFFEEHLKFTIFASPNLVLKGLNEILEINA
jgi:type III pantothenate kinase